MNRILMVVLESFLVVVLFEMKTDGFLVDRRSAASERNFDDYPDYQLGVKYDEYPMIVPKKRTTSLADRLMVALQRAIEDEEAAGKKLDLTNSYALSPEKEIKIPPKKRTALLVDRLMVALQQAIEEEESANKVDGPPLTNSYALSPEEVRKMDLQRRGHGSMSSQQKGRVYWRCYFNAVTCF